MRKITVSELCAGVVLDLKNENYMLLLLKLDTLIKICDLDDEMKPFKEKFENTRKWVATKIN